jgi:hypothetical protein
MDVQAGWYAAGEPGKVRWWDGTRWTDREAEVPAGPWAVPLGWYMYPPSGQPRWWDGTRWTAYRVKSRRVAVEPYVFEPPALGWIIGGAFVVMGTLNLTGGSASPSVIGLGVVLLGLAVLYFVGAGRAVARRRVAAPTTAALINDSLRPFPGDVEGSDAGWYPVTGIVHRWWTGSRWAEYVSESGSVRPTQFGPRSYRVAMIGSAALGVVGLILLASGTAQALTGDIELEPSFLFGFGAMLVPMAVVVWSSTRFRKYATLVPPGPPPVR